VKLLRHIFLAVAALIFLGHSFVPHTHLSGNDEESFHHHDDEHQGLGDLIVCFFEVDHDSEDLDNFVTPDFDTALPATGYAVIPKIYFEQEPPASHSFIAGNTCLSTPFLRGPPAV
jgi:hypothetical protein